MIVFADTNWLEALYFEPREDDPAAQVRSTLVTRHMRKRRDPLSISHFILMEARNVFGRISGRAQPAEWEDLLADMHGKILLQPFDWPALREQVNRLFERFSHKAVIGSFDVTIVASAKLAGASELLSFDETIKALAITVGIRVFPELRPEGKRTLAALKA